MDQCVYNLKGLVPIKANKGRWGCLDLPFEILVHIFGVAIGAFHPAVLARDLQPNAWMSERAFAPITSYAKTINDLGFGYRGFHQACSLYQIAALSAL